MDKEILLRRSRTGLEKVEGVIYKGYGIYKENTNNQYYCILIKGSNKGYAVCNCSKLELLREFIDKSYDILKPEEIENNISNPKMTKLNKLRNEYWIL